jgi:hypothetical protein
MVRLELRGRPVVLSREQALRAQSLAEAGAGSSSGLRDLALVLDWALNTPQVVALRRSEARDLERLASEHVELGAVAAALRAGTDARAA